MSANSSSQRDDIMIALWRRDKNETMSSRQTKCEHLVGGDVCDTLCMCVCVLWFFIDLPLLLIK